MEQNTNLLLTPSVKNHRGTKREYPFPIVSRSCGDDQTDQNWKCIEGHLQNNYVLVHDEEDIKTLYTMGYYGKGTLSKNAPKVCSQKGKKSVKQMPNLELQESSVDEDIIAVLDSEDENLILKKEEEPDNIEVLLSVSSSDEESHPSRKVSEEESLQLTLEEAYFLSYGLGCLIVLDKNQPLNLARLWIKFCELTPNENFPVRYTAYHHFRSKGWIVKSGMKFGADYVLYKDGPPFYHATYSVIIKSLKDQNLREARGNNQLTWSSSAALNRVNSTAGKGLMFLYVMKPSNISDNKISTPFCIPQFKLQEVLFKRWVPSENREQND